MNVLHALADHVRQMELKWSSCKIDNEQIRLLIDHNQSAIYISVRDDLIYIGATRHDEYNTIRKTLRVVTIPLADPKCFATLESTIIRILDVF